MNMQPQCPIRFASLVVSILLLCAIDTRSAFAAPTSPAQGLLDDNFNISVGAYVIGTATKVRLNGNATVASSDIDFDETLGSGSDATRIRVDALWRITATQHLRLLYFKHDIRRSKTIETNVAWGDYTFQADSNLTGEHNLDVYELAYEYAFIRKPDYEIAGSLGLHVLDMTLLFAGTATVTGDDGVVSSASFLSEKNSLPAPLPVIGLRAGWVVAPQWYIDAQAQLFDIDLDGYDGFWSDVRVSTTWMFRRHLGIGLGYNRFKVDVDVSKPDFDGRLRFGYSGLQAFLTASF